MAQTQIVELLCIGREILDGRVIDTNSVWLALQLKERGLIPRFAQKVDDDKMRIIDALKLAASRAEIVLVTGGLGPTSDDITAECVGAAFGLQMETHPEAMRWITEAFAKMQRPMNDVQKKQALLPAGCTLLFNRAGTAPGFAVKVATAQHLSTLYFMPGVPREMKLMFEHEIASRLPEAKAYRSVSWGTQFTSEGELQRRLAPLIEQLPPEIELSFRTRMPENHIGLHGDLSTPELVRTFDFAVDQITETLGEDVFCTPEILPLEKILVDQLREKKLRMVTAESCTGGLIASRITDVAGSSDVFWGSWIVYDNKAKEELGVARDTLNRNGAVSEESARELAHHALRKLQAAGVENGIALVTTGIAGPSGGSAEKPVGLCWIGLALSDGTLKTEKFLARAGLERTDYKMFFAQRAMELLRKTLLEF